MGMLKSLAAVSGFTLMSRLLGFVRDIFVAKYLGTGAMGDAFQVAFRFPNFFRRIFGEGAFNSAFIPLFGRELEEHGKEVAEQFASRAFTFMTLVLGIASLVAIPLMHWLMAAFVPGFMEDPEKFAMTVNYSQITFAYLLCMALAALLSGVLNTLKIFAIPAFAPVLLNIIFLIGLTVVVPRTGNPGLVLSWCVFISGFAQLGLLFFACRRRGINIRFVSPKMTPRMKRLFILMGPGIVAAGVQQVNLLIGTQISSSQESAVSYLYFSERIYQLPLGMIGIAFGVVLLPEITRKLRAKQEGAAINTINRGIELAMLITLPAAVAMFVISGSIIGTLFEGGKFTPDSTRQTAMALAAFATGLPGYVLIKVLQPGFFAREDTKRPMFYAGITVTVNIAFSLVLFKFYRHVGIACATSIAAWVNVVLLWRGLHGFLTTDSQLRSRLPRIFLASLVMGAVLWALQIAVEPWYETGGYHRTLSLGLLVTVGTATFAAAALALKAASLSELKANFTRRS